MVVASGSGLHEATMRNCVRARGEGRVINFVSGAFGQRWHQTALGCDKDAIRVDINWCTAVQPEDVTRALENAMQESDVPVDAITVVHNETSTGVMQPVGEIAAAVREASPQTLVLVDAVSSFGWRQNPHGRVGVGRAASRRRRRRWRLPPGLSFAAVSDRVLARAEGVKGRGWYFDFLNLEKYLQRSTTPATPAISLMRALSVQLDIIFEEGVEERFARHERLAKRAQQWALDHGFALMAEAGYRSQTVTHVENTRGLDIKDVNRFLAERDMQISNGYGDYKGQVVPPGTHGRSDGRGFGAAVWGTGKVHGSVNDAETL